MATYQCKPHSSWKSVQTILKKSSKFTKKITHVNDMMIHNFVKYLIQTRFYLWDIKITNKVVFGQDIFYKTVYHHVIYMCDFFGEFRPLFCRDLHEFSQSCGLHQICSLWIYAVGKKLDDRFTSYYIYYK